MIWLAIPAALVAAGLVAAVVLLRRRYAVVDVDGRSMEPTLRAGDRVLVHRTTPDTLRVGDIVVIEDFGPWPGRPPAGRARMATRRLAARQWIVKRVAACPGDPVPAPLTRIESVPAGEPVPANRFVLLGDNLDHSSDSRTHGFYRGDDILGVMVRPMR